MDSSTPWQPSIFQRFIRTVETSSYPAIIVTDAGSAYLKAINNPEGPHILACDWFGTQLARRFGLQTFDVAMLHLTDVDEIPIGKGKIAAPGPAFVSRAEEGGPMDGGSTLKHIQNTEDLAKFVIFDTWVRNCDRFCPGYHLDGAPRVNRDNLFLSAEGCPSGKFVLKAIDHGHIFSCGRELTSQLGYIGNVQERKLYGLFPEFRERVTLAQIDEGAMKFKDVDPALWEDLLADLPVAWEITPSIRTAISQFLLDRARFLLNNLHDIAHDEMQPGTLNFGSHNGG